MTRSAKAPANVCPVCMGPGGTVVSMCSLCQRSYDQTTGGDIISVIVWAAARARGAERERARLAKRLRKAGLL